MRKEPPRAQARPWPTRSPQLGTSPPAAEGTAESPDQGHGPGKVRGCGRGAAGHARVGKDAGVLGAT